MWFANILFIVLIFGISSANWAFGRSVDWPTSNLCIRAALPIENTHRIPHGLLNAISLKETGRWSNKKKVSFAWPWTVTAKGKGIYLPSKVDAIAEVNRLKKQGVTNIDVGCMQINLFYHPNAFSSLEKAFDPFLNTKYGAEFLAKLFVGNGSWELAVERYHSGDRARGKRYRLAVQKLRRAPELNQISNLNDHRSEIPPTKRPMREHRKYSTKNLSKLYVSRTTKNRELRKAFLERKAKVLQRWKEMMQKRKHREVLAKATHSS